MPLMTSIKHIGSYSPCYSGFRKLTEYRANNKLDFDADFPFIECLDSNPLDDCLWALQMFPEYNQVWRAYSIWLIRHFHMDDVVHEEFGKEIAKTAIKMIAEEISADEVSDVRCSANNYVHERYYAMDLHTRNMHFLMMRLLDTDIGATTAWIYSCIIRSQYARKNAFFEDECKQMLRELIMEADSNE